jgi:RNA polymerase sigma-70 factor (ECF subfamily)
LSTFFTIRLSASADLDQATEAFPREVTTEEPSDERLISLVCNGDKEALAVLFRRYARIVRGIAFRILRDPAEADDLLQDLFLLVWRLCRKFDSSKGTAQFWLLQMAYRRAISRRRHLNSQHFYTRVPFDYEGSEAAESGSDFVDESLDQIHAGLDLRKLFASLSEDQQKTLRLHFIEGYTLEEIATILGQTKGNIRHHSFRGLEKLRKQIFGSKVPEHANSSNMSKGLSSPGSRGVVAKRTP